MRPTYSALLGVKSIDAEMRRRLDASIPYRHSLTGDWIDFNATGLDLFFLYGAIKSGDLKPCRTGENTIMVSYGELLEAVKQDRYAYIELASRKDNQLFAAAILAVAFLVYMLLLRFS